MEARSTQTLKHEHGVGLEAVCHGSIVLISIFIISRGCHRLEAQTTTSFKNQLVAHVIKC